MLILIKTFKSCDLCGCIKEHFQNSFMTRNFQGRSLNSENVSTGVTELLHIWGRRTFSPPSLSHLHKGITTLKVLNLNIINEQFQRLRY